MEEGRWVTLKSGLKVFIEEGQTLMDALIRQEATKERTKELEEKSKKRWKELEEKYKDVAIENNEQDENTITLKPYTPGDEKYEEADFYTDFSYSGKYNSTTQKELNLMPIRIDTFVESENEWGYKEKKVFAKIFQNRKAMESDLKTYGGLKQFTDGDQYFIKSQSGIGEYYLVRDKFYKTGWVWQDCNGDVVYGAENVDHTRLENKWRKAEEEIRKEHPEWYN